MDLWVNFFLNGYVLKAFTTIRNARYAKHTKRANLSLHKDRIREKRRILSIMRNK